MQFVSVILQWKVMILVYLILVHKKKKTISYDVKKYYMYNTLYSISFYRHMLKRQVFLHLLRHSFTYKILMTYCDYDLFHRSIFVLRIPLFKADWYLLFSESPWLLIRIWVVKYLNFFTNKLIWEPLFDLKKIILFYSCGQRYRSILVWKKKHGTKQWLNGWFMLNVQ